MTLKQATIATTFSSNMNAITEIQFSIPAIAGAKQTLFFNTDHAYQLGLLSMKRQNSKETHSVQVANDLEQQYQHKDFARSINPLGIPSEQGKHTWSNNG